MRVLVTGGAGFIGSSFAKKARQQGWQVTVLDNLSTGHKSTFDEFRVLAGADPRIGTSHTQVPGWDGRFGWGGHCLDKDNHEFMNFSESPLVEFIVNLNNTHRGKTHEHSKLAASQQEGEEANS